MMNYHLQQPWGVKRPRPKLKTILTHFTSPMHRRDTFFPVGRDTFLQKKAFSENNQRGVTAASRRLNPRPAPFRTFILA